MGWGFLQCLKLFIVLSSKTRLRTTKKQATKRRSLILTALSPKFRTLQFKSADCPTVAVISRFVVLSKYGWAKGVSQYDDGVSPVNA